MADTDRISQQLKALPTGMDPQSKRLRRQRFGEIDNNGNGILSLAEVDHAVENTWGIDVPKPVINRAFHASRDLAPPVAGFSNDYIDFGEFRVFMIYMQHYYDLFNLYKKIDTSRDGRLGMDEFVQAVPLLQSWGVAGLNDPVRSFQKMDADGGGMVLFDEFAHWALNQGVTDLVEDDADKAEALKLLRNAKANLCSKDLDGMKHAKYSVTGGISGQGALGGPGVTFDASDVGRLLLGASLGMGSSVLEVTVHQANGLRVADKTTSDPYAVLTYGGEDAQTKTIKRNLNPIWNETLRFPNDGTHLEINLYDYDVQSSDDFLGKVIIVDKTLLAGKDHRVRMGLTGPGAQGTIDVSFKWQNDAPRRTVEDYTPDTPAVPAAPSGGYTAPDAPVAPTSGPGGKSLGEKIKEISDLKDQGILSEAEFTAAKARIISGN